MMNKRELYESIMRNAAIEVKKALNEAIYFDDEDNESFEETAEDIADDNSEFDDVTLLRFADGGRTILESRWHITVNAEYDDYWKVTAECIYSDDNRYREDNMITFDLYKEDDIEYCLKDALDKAGF